MPTARPWWKRKRWHAFILFWLVIAYPCSIGPAHYAAGRGWAPVWTLKIYTPLVWLFPGEPGDGSGFEFVSEVNDYHARWWSLGERHAAEQWDRVSGISGK